jgi:hypothetical protein
MKMDEKMDELLGRGVVMPEMRIASAISIGADHPGAGPDGPGPEAARTNPETIPPRPPEFADSGRRAKGAFAEAVYEIPSERPNSPFPVDLEDAVGADTATATELAEHESVPPPPQVSSVLTVFPSFNLSALERGLQQFLEQVETLDRSLPGGGSGSMLYLWIAAVAAATTALDVARRQLRRPTAGPAVDANPIPGSRPDAFLAG